MVINTWGMSEQGLNAVEEQDACAMPNTNCSGSELQNTRLDMIKNTGTLGKMVNPVILTERLFQGKNQNTVVKQEVSA